MPVAHISGVPVEETLQPLMIAVLLSGAWLSTRLRRPFNTFRKERTPSDGTR
jgi:hypothetical protein